jgi:hypothetical protein
MTDKKTEPDFFEKAKADIATAEEVRVEEASIEEWAPKNAGETLRGYFMKAERVFTKFGPRYKVWLKDYDTEVTISVFCAPKLLLDGILDASPAAGSLIVFEYGGKATGNSGFEYGVYAIRAEKADPTLWAEITRPKAGEEDKVAERERAKAAASAPLTSMADPY